MPKIVLDVQNISKSFVENANFFNKLTGSNSNEELNVLTDITFSLDKSEILGIVGESGCGKTTLAKIILGLIRPDSGKIQILGHNLNSISNSHLTFIRRQTRMIFQNPGAVLNPYMRISESLNEVLKLHSNLDEMSRIRRINECLNDVGLSMDYAGKYPHEMSGGEQRRATIARALILDCQLIIADEPLAALDATIREDIMKRLINHRDKFSTSFIVISHDINIIKRLCDRIAVLYQGEIVEINSSDNFEYTKVNHAYSKHLLQYNLSVDSDESGLRF